MLIIISCRIVGRPPLDSVLDNESAPLHGALVKNAYKLLLCFFIKLMIKVPWLDCHMGEQPLSRRENVILILCSYHHRTLLNIGFQSDRFDAASI